MGLDIWVIDIWYGGVHLRLGCAGKNIMSASSIVSSLSVPVFLRGNMSTKASEKYLFYPYSFVFFLFFLFFSPVSFAACWIEPDISGHVLIPAGTRTVPAYAFSKCDPLASITFPSSLTTIGVGAFNNCIHLTSLDIPSSVSTIGNDAFSQCTGLTSLQFAQHGASLIEIGMHAFYGCIRLTTLRLPPSLTKVGPMTFIGCKGLKTIEFPSGLEIIGDGAFYGCTSLEKLIFPPALKKIGRGAFKECMSLKSARLASTRSFVSIEKSAFDDCPKLQNKPRTRGNNELWVRVCRYVHTY